MTRILYLVDPSGSADAPLALPRLLRRIDRARFEPFALFIGADGGAAAAARALGVEVLALEAGEERGALGALQRALDARRLPAQMGGRSFDLLHARGPAADLLARLAAPRLGARAVVTTFDGAAPADDRWRRRTERRTAGRVARFVLPAAALEPALRGRPGCAAAPCAVVPDGIDLAEADAGLAPGRDDARRRLGLFATDVAIVHAGPLDAEAGAANLLAAFHSLLQEMPTARLLVAGDGPARPALEAAAAALRLAPFARFLGALPSPWPLLAAADIFVQPGVRRGVPFGLLDAMAARLPVAAADGDCAREVTDGGRTALLVPPGDPAALTRALADLGASPVRRRELGALARGRAETEYPIERSAAALQALYAEVPGSLPARS